jgi:hypothetical protein
MTNARVIFDRRAHRPGIGIEGDKCLTGTG